MKQIMQRILMNIRRNNFFSSAIDAIQRIHFIFLQGFIVFHRGITFTLGPNEPFGRSISLNSAPPRS